jgi:hypothetical protein
MKLPASHLRKERNRELCYAICCARCATGLVDYARSWLAAKRRSLTMALARHAARVANHDLLS